MRRVWFVIALLLLTACSPTSSYVKGEVVSCESIAQDKSVTGGVTMDCLDRSEGAQLGALRGPMVINVWGSWCGPCKEEMPYLRSFYDKAKGKVALIGVDVEEANFDFRNGRVIGDQFIDHAFVLDDRTARIELRAPSGKGSWLSSDENAKWCQIHTADRDGGPGSRMQLAVEPMTCAVDAFNSKEDVIELAPGASHSMWWKIGSL